MKEKIEYVLCELSSYGVNESWQDNYYYHVRLNDYVVTSVLFRRLLEQELIFVISSHLCDDQSIVISFCKD